jgi:DNA-binding CsgD family transcriptional regulator
MGMTKDILIQLITKALVLDLVLLEISYLASWLVALKLGFRILELEVRLKEIFFGALIGASTNLFIKPFLPIPAAAFIQFFLLLLFLKTLKKVRFIKAFWATFLTLIIIFLGALFIEGPLCFVDPRFAFYLTKTPYGMILGVLIETLFPVIALLILSKHTVTLIPPLGKRLVRLDIIGVFTFGFMFFSVYNSTIKLYLAVKNNPKDLLMHLFYDWMTTVGAVLGGYLILTTIQKQREIERRNLESELESKQQNLESEQQRFKLEQQKFESERRKFIMEKENLETRIKELDDLNNRLKDRKLGPEEVDDFFNKLRSYGDLVIQNMKRDDERDQQRDDFNFDVLPAVKFTRREKDVLRLIATGASNEAIAQSLFLSPGRVVNIVSDLKSKTGLDKNKLIVYAIYWVKKNQK